MHVWVIRGYRYRYVAVFVLLGYVLWFEHGVLGSWLVFLSVCLLRGDGFLGWLLVWLG